MILSLLFQKRFIPALPRFGYSNSYKSRCFQAIHTQSNNGVVDFFDRLLQHLTSSVDDKFDHERPVKQIHAQIVFTYSLSSAFLSARLISTYAKLSLLDDARKVFDTCPEDCFFSSLFWNSMLRAYISAFSYEDALEIYSQMRLLNVQPDGFGFPLIIKACAMRGDVRLGKTVHWHAVQTGLSNNLHIGNELVGMYGEFGLTDIALKVFDQMPLRSRVSWNIMISNFAKNHDCDGAYGMHCRMVDEGWEPNSVTWTSLVSSFARSGRHDKTWELYVLMREKEIDATAESIAVVISACSGMLFRGEIVHGHVITGGFEKYIFVSNALISMYGRNGAVENAEFLFSVLGSKSIVTWNALISAYAQSGLCDEALSAFQRLQNLEDNSMVKPNVVSWTALINAFAASGLYNETTLELFRCMQFAQVFANAVTVASVLSVCAELSALRLGREIHAYAIRLLMDSDMLVTNGLINMYMKSGSLQTGQSLFERMVYRDIISWNVMITGYGMHGLGDEAVKTFYRMLRAGVKPDEVTFVAVLSACSHAGLVAEGRELFTRMIRDFEIVPRVEHYACMVDLFGRAGLLEEAGRVLKSMPMQPNAPVWGALLNSYEMHKNADSAEETAAKIFHLNTEVMGSYMLLSNLYAASGRWDESAKVRVSARARGLRKTAGQSWIEVKKKVHSFSAGKALNLDMEELHVVLQDLSVLMVMDSCVSEGLFEII